MRAMTAPRALSSTRPGRHPIAIIGVGSYPFPAFAGAAIEAPGVIAAALRRIGHHLVQHQILVDGQAVHRADARKVELAKTLLGCVRRLEFLSSTPDEIRRLREAQIFKT